MEFRKGNEHLVSTPEGFEIGDLVEVSRQVDGPFGPKDTKWLGTINSIITDGIINSIIIDEISINSNIFFQVLPVSADEGNEITVDKHEMTLIARPEDVTNFSDETLEKHIAELHDLTYRPVIKKKKGKTGSVRKKAKTTPKLETTVKNAVKTGKISSDTLAALIANAEQTLKGD